MSDLLNDKFYISFNCIDLILKTSLNFIFTVKSFSVKLHSWKPQRPSWHKPLPPMEGGQPCKRKNLSNHIFCSLEHSTITPLSPHFPCDGQNLERERMRIQFVASTFTHKNHLLHCSFHLLSQFQLILPSSIGDVPKLGKEFLCKFKPWQCMVVFTIGFSWSLFACIIHLTIFVTCWFQWLNTPFLSIFNRLVVVLFGDFVHVWLFLFIFLTFE